MILSYHGGACCGIKHIHDMGTNPNSLCKALDEQDEHSLDMYGFTMYTVRPDKNFHWEKAPEEKKVDRLDRYLNFLRKHRPKTLVEICLIEKSPNYSFSVQTAWFPILEERGFKKVRRFINGNTGKTIAVFHLDLGKKVIKKKKEGE